MSECLMPIMSAHYSHRTGVKVSFVRDENKKEACYSSAFVVFSLSLSRSRALSLALSLSKSRLTSRRSRKRRAFFGPLTYAWLPCRLFWV